MTTPFTTTLPFGQATACRCHAVVQQSQDCIATACRSSTAAIETAASAVLASTSMDWEGVAAQLFHTRMGEMQQTLAQLGDDVEATRRQSLWGGTS